MNKHMVLIMLSLVSIIGLNSCMNSPKTVEDDSNTAVTASEVLESLYPPADLVIASHSEFTKQHYPQRIAEFKKNPLQLGDIVFLGNSITEEGGDWNEKISRKNAKNRGISGDTSEGVLARMKEVTYFKPTQVFILIGINDLFNEKISGREVFENILKIVEKLEKESPNTEIFVQTILPANTASIVEKIKSTNEFIRLNAQNEGYKIIDLHPLYIGSSDFMNMDYSYDGVHLNEKGYEIWVDTIKHLVK
ncbi:GDSL-type esterase/lipase family protein [Flagellimonas flava]|uniref:GDSL-type esterase/lipase family protein n=1 Tax=Flagellimonas flava TaxID=570519 RepID=UPI003D64D5EC